MTGSGRPLSRVNGRGTWGLDEGARDNEDEEEEEEEEEEEGRRGEEGLYLKLERRRLYLLSEVPTCTGKSLPSCRGPLHFGAGLFEEQF